MLFFATHMLYGLSVFKVTPENASSAQRYIDRIKSDPYKSAWWLDEITDADVDVSLASTWAPNCYTG